MTRTHQEFLELLEKSNDAYRSGEIEILTEYIRQDVLIEVKTKYGVCLMQPQYLLKNAKPRLLSAKDKHEYFCNMVLEKRGELPDFIDKYESSDIKIRINTKYGVCAMNTNSLLKNDGIGIDSAENKTEFAINRFKEIYGDKYDYSKFEYKGAQDRGTIICPIHGEFTQNNSDHLGGHGCQKCSMGDDFKVPFQAKSKEEFIDEVYKVNKQLIDGEIELLSEYEGTNTKILVKDKFGVCAIVPRGLFSNKKSSIFSAVDKTSYWINMAKAIHGDKYDYTKTVYSGSKNVITITCPIHGDFEQQASMHLLGQGCQMCANEKKGHNRSTWAKAAEGNPGVLYILKCYNDEETFLKVGITCHTVKIRYKSDLRLPYNYEVLYSVEDMDRDKIWNLEKTLHRKVGNYKYKPNKSFDGMYECFTIDGLDILEKHLKKEKLIL